MISGVLAALSIVLQSCERDSISSSRETLFVEIDGIGVTNVWIRLGVYDQGNSPEVRLKRDGHIVMTLSPAVGDTVVIDEELSPNHTYQYRSVRVENSVEVDSTAVQVVTTMDTTSHDFDFELQYLGDGSASVINDIVIPREGLAYAVGDVSFFDSVWTPYNFFTWDGAEWTYSRILYDVQGTQLFDPLRAIFFVADNDVWVGGTTPRHWNGSIWEQFSVDPTVFSDRINSIWSSTRTYIFGNNGAAAFYENGTWNWKNSGTIANLNDAWGGSNRWVGDDVILVAASDKGSVSEKRLLRIDQNGILDSLDWPMQDRRIHSVWFDDQSALFTSGGGVFRLKGDAGWSEMPIPLLYTNRVRGNGINDIWVVGDFGFVAHFNGLSWQTYPEVALTTGVYESVDVLNGTMIAVGWEGSRAVVLTGTRQ